MQPKLQFGVLTPSQPIREHDRHPDAGIVWFGAYFCQAKSKIPLLVGLHTKWKCNQILRRFRTVNSSGCTSNSFSVSSSAHTRSMLPLLLFVVSSTGDTDASTVWKSKQPRLSYIERFCSLILLRAWWIRCLGPFRCLLVVALPPRRRCLLSIHKI